MLNLDHTTCAMSLTQVTQAHTTANDPAEFNYANPFSVLSREISLYTIEHCKVLIKLAGTVAGLLYFLWH